MIREAYKVVMDEPSFGENGHAAPLIVKTNVTDQEGVSWREAKKQLRKWYLDQAASLRAVTQKSYFGEQQ